MRKLTSRLTLTLCLALGLLCPAAPAIALSPAEEARVETLLQALGQEKDLIFIRNDAEHSAEEAVAHLRLKLSRSSARLESAEEFIDRAASSSSLSGKPYLIRRAGQEAVPAGPLLHKILRRVAPE